MRNSRINQLLNRSLTGVLLLGAVTFIASPEPSQAAQGSECVVGSSFLCPATSPQEIYNLYGAMAADGTYYLKVNGTSTQVYLKMNRTGSDNGSWILLMKGVRGTSNFGYTSNYFALNNTTLNTASLADDVTTDAKFSVYNDLSLTKMLAVMKDPTTGLVSANGDIQSNSFGGHVWLETLPSASTAYTRLTTALRRNSVENDVYTSVPKSKYFTSATGTQVFSFQRGNGRYGFNGAPCSSTNYRYRWGIAWNQEPDFVSCDVVVGIGLGGFSSGDQVGWAGVTDGSVTSNTGHGNMGFQIWGKVAEPTLGAPTAVTATIPASGQVNLSWTAPSGVSPIDYVVQYKTSTSETYSNSLVVSDQTTASITGLSGAPNYNFRVFARTATDSTSDATSSTITTTVKSSQTLTFATTNYSKVFGETQTVSATSAGTGAITYSSGTSTACTVLGAVVTISSGAGTCVITASRAPDDNYLAATSTNSVTFAVSKAAQSGFVLTSTSGTFLSNLRLLTSGGSGAGAISYSVGSPGTAGCSVSNVDSLTTTSPGTCIVVAKKETTADYLVAYDTRTVTVAKASLTFFTSAAASLKYGSTTTASYTTNRSLGFGGVPNLNGTLSYETSTSTACRIESSTGLITMNRSNGTCNVRVSLINDTNFTDTGSSLISIIPAKADTLTVTASSINMIYSGDTQTISYNYSISGLRFVDTVTALSYAYSGTANSGVGTNGTSSVTAAGTYLITPSAASVTNSDSYTAFTYATGTLTVNRATRTISASAVPTMKYGGQETVTVLTLPSSSSDGAISFSAGSSTACSVVSATGRITMNRAAGTCSVVPTIAQGANYLAATGSALAIEPAKADAISLIAINKSSTYTGSSASITPTYSVSGLQFSDTVTVTYGYSGSANSGANYPLSGTKPTNAGVYSIVPTVTLTNADSYTAPSANVTNGTLTINRATRTLNATNYSSSSLKYGDTATVISNLTSPSSNSDGAFTYVVSSGCSVDSLTGQITATNYLDTCSETTTVGQGNNYETATANAVIFTLSKADTITARANIPVALTYTGSPAIVSPTFTVSGLVAGNTASGATFRFSRSSSPAISGYSSSLIAPTNAGNYAITPSVLILGNGITTDYYKSVLYESATLTINKANQSSFTNYYTLFGIFGSSVNIYKFGGNGDGQETLTATNGTAAGCTLIGTVLTVATAGTCVITATKAASENHLETSSVFTVFVYYYVPPVVVPTPTAPTQIAVASPNAWNISPSIGPSITGISPTSGPVGTVITITGIGMNGVDEIKIGRKQLTSITGINSTSVSGVIPAGSTSGPILVSNSMGSHFMSNGFTVTP